MFNVGEILLMLNDVQAEEAGINQPYLAKGSKLRVINIISKDVVHALLLSVEKKSYESPNGVFMIIREDVDNGDVVSISEMREDKLNKILYDNN